MEKKIPILMYHSISCSTNPRFAQFAVSPIRFAEQMTYLHEHGYTPVTVTQWVESLRRQLPEKLVILTFDDGMADFYTNALPILARYGFGATLYITTSFVGGACGWLQREGEATRRMLTWSQIAEIQAAGIECGGHTHTHPQLDMLPLTKARSEIVTCKRMLEDALGQQVQSFAYPYGYYTKAIQRLVQAAGYTSACAVKHSMNAETTNLFALTRLMVEAATDMSDFENLLTGRSSYRLSTIYARMRTPVWQVVRRSTSLAIKR
jgi:peptidoglycan/xylan/chitin deacetylase (PgdA/CDA1 family)